jgi:hypothetical protein
MRHSEFATQTKTPDQLRIDSLKVAKEKAVQAVQAERQRQQVAKAQKALTTAKQPQVPVLLSSSS